MVGLPDGIHKRDRDDSRQLGGFGNECFLAETDPDDVPRAAIIVDLVASAIIHDYNNPPATSTFWSSHPSESRPSSLTSKRWRALSPSNLFYRALLRLLHFAPPSPPSSITHKYI